MENIKIAGQIAIIQTVYFSIGVLLSFIIDWISIHILKDDLKKAKNKPIIMNVLYTFLYICLVAWAVRITIYLVQYTFIRDDGLLGWKSIPEEGKGGIVIGFGFLFFVGDIIKAHTKRALYDWKH
jgi:hypothetical protein